MLALEGDNRADRADQQATRRAKLGVSTTATVLVGLRASLRYSLRPLEIVRDYKECLCALGKVPTPSTVYSKGGSTELACGSQAFIATLLFDSSMSALPIIASQQRPSVGLFIHQQGT